MNPAADNSVQRAADLLRNARSICVSTGAGMSAESGVPTFRDAAGLWSNFNPEELATPQAFARDPKKVWAWYRWRRTELAKIQPHAGHRILAEWESRLGNHPSDPKAPLRVDSPNRFTIITQNVDGLHHRADSKNILELHGRLDVARCTNCEYQVQGLDDLGEDPRCLACGHRIRPGVVWFNEPLPEQNFLRAFEAARECEIMLLIGTSGIVQPAASLTETALEYGAKLIEINPNPTPFSRRAAVHLAANCGQALTSINTAWRRGEM